MKQNMNVVTGTDSVKMTSAPTENGKKVLTMAEYIEREALRDTLYDADAITMSGDKILNQFPGADVAPVRHGRWVDRIVDENEVIQPWMERYYCSECLEGGNQSWFKFCPNCGAKMDGGDGDEVD